LTSSWQWHDKRHCYSVIKANLKIVSLSLNGKMNARSTVCRVWRHWDVNVSSYLVVQLLRTISRPL